MEKIKKEQLKEYRYVLLVLYVPIYFAGFFLVEKLVPATADYWVSYCPADDLIPFCEYFVVPYYLWYVLLFTVGIYLMIKDPRQFKLYMYCIIIGFSFCVIFCVLFPNGQDLRPAVFPRDNFFTDMVRAIYTADTNTNVIPSVHVIGAIFAAFGVCSTKTLKKTWLKPGSVFLAALISISTCFIKQHSLLDVVAGVLLAGIIYPIVYIFIQKHMKKS